MAKIPRHLGAKLQTKVLFTYTCWRLCLPRSPIHCCFWYSFHWSFHLTRPNQYKLSALNGRGKLQVAVLHVCIDYWQGSRAFFNYITGGAKAPPAPMVAPPLNHFGPPSQSPFSLKYRQNMEFRREVWYSSNWNLLCESYVLSFNFI
jgi:hypothetical protein